MSRCSSAYLWLIITLLSGLIKMPTSNHRQCGQPTGGCFQVCHSVYRLEATHLGKLALDKTPGGVADSLQTPAWLGKGAMSASGAARSMLEL